MSNDNLKQRVLQGKNDHEKWQWLMTRHKKTFRKQIQSSNFWTDQEKQSIIKILKHSKKNLQLFFDFLEPKYSKRLSKCSAGYFELCVIKNN